MTGAKGVGGMKRDAPFKSFEEWQECVPAVMRRDTMWKLEVYRLALFAGDLAWFDAGKISATGQWRSLSDQLYRAVGSISANICEGYSRPTEKDQIRFYWYALGSARESRDWYFKSRHLLDEAVTHHRINLISNIIGLLVRFIKSADHSIVKEQQEPYDLTSTSDLLATIPYTV